MFGILYLDIGIYLGFGAWNLEFNVKFDITIHYTKI